MIENSIPNEDLKQANDSSTVVIIMYLSGSLLVKIMPLETNKSYLLVVEP